MFVDWDLVLETFLAATKILEPVLALVAVSDFDPETVPALVAVLEAD